LFNDIFQNCVDYYDNHSPKKLEFLTNKLNMNILAPKHNILYSIHDLLTKKKLGDSYYILKSFIQKYEGYP